MARIMGIFERREQFFYDTCELDSNQQFHFFDDVSRLGHYAKTNLVVAGQLGYDHSAVTIHTFGVRFLGRDKETAIVLSDFVHFSLEIGDKPQVSFYGPQTIMFLDTLDEPGLPSSKCGYQFATALVVPVRQHFRVGVRVDKDFTRVVGEPFVATRIHLGCTFNVRIR